MPELKEITSEELKQWRETATRLITKSWYGAELSKLASLIGIVLRLIDEVEIYQASAPCDCNKCIASGYCDGYVIANELGECVNIRLSYIRSHPEELAKLRKENSQPSEAK